MSSQKYEQLSRLPENDDASSDVTVSFNDEEARWKGGYEPSTRSPVLTLLDRLGPLRWVFEVGLVAIIIILLLGRGDERYQLVGDVTGFAPRCKLIACSLLRPDNRRMPGE